MKEQEICIACGEATGRAGRGDDSLYCETCDKGPYCLECHYTCENVHSMSAGGAGP